MGLRLFWWSQIFLNKFTAIIQQKTTPQATLNTISFLDNASLETVGVNGNWSSASANAEDAHFNL